MFIKGSYLNNLFLTPDVRIPESGADISWLQGDTVTGYVEQVYRNGLVKLIVKGKVMEALSEIPLSPGQKLSLYVSEVRPGYVHLRVLAPESGAQRDNQKLFEVLQKLNIKPDETTLFLAAKLVETGLPVSQENLTRLSSVVKLLGGPTTETLKTGLWVVSRKSELLPEQVLALRTFLTGTNNVGVLLTEAGELLARMAGQENQNDGAVAAGFSAAASVGRGDYGEPPLIEELPVFRVAEEDGSSDKVPAANRGRLPDLIPLQLPAVRNALARLLEAVTVSLKEYDGLQTGVVHEVIKGFPDTARALAVLELIIAEYVKNKGDSEVIRQALDKIRTARRELEGQQIFNVLTNQERDNQQLVFYVTLPVLVGGKFHLCELKVTKDSTGTRQAGDEKPAFTLALSLGTSTMGFVVFHLTCFSDSRLLMQVVSEDRRAGSYLQSELPDLIQNLEKLGFKVDRWEVKVVEDKQQNLKSGLIENERLQLRFGIDIVV